MKQNIKAVLFDLGKVIVDFDFTPAFGRLSRHCAKKPHEIREYFLRSGLEVLYDGGKISSAEFYRKIKTDLGHSLDYGRFKKIWNEVFTLNKETGRLIKKLKRRYRLVLISNTNALHYKYLCGRYTVLEHFDRHILSYKEKIRKPDEKIYRTAIRACRAKPHEILYIDDRSDLTEAARALGIHSFTFRNNHGELREKMRILGVSFE